MVRPLSLKARLTALFIAIFGVSLFAFGVYIYQTVDEVLETSFHLQLESFANEVADSINYSILWGFRFYPQSFIDNKKVFPFTMKEAVIQIRSASGTPLTSSKALRGQSLPFNRVIFEKLMDGHKVYSYWQSEEPIAGNSHFRAVSMIVKGKPDGFIVLQVAVPDRYIRDNNEKILKTFLYSIPIVLLIASIVGYSYVGFSLRPVKRIIERVHSIRGGNLSERVPVPQVQDEIAKLAVTINNMLDRVETSFEAQERFVSDASHQLKTPLAVLKAQIEEMQRNAASDGNQTLSREQKDKLSSLGEEVESLISLVKNLLILARVDVGEQTLHFSEFPLDETVATVCERLSHIAKRKNIQFQLDLEMLPHKESTLKHSPFQVYGDSDLLASVFQSIVENSIKYSPDNTKIKIQVLEKDTHIVVSMQDEGPGISQSELETVFDRFRRGASSAKVAPGSGLGLSIARRISELHGAQLSLSNASEGGLKTHFSIKKV